MHVNKLIAVALVLLALTGASRAGDWVTSPQGSPEGLMRRLDRAHWIAAGAKSAGRVVYVFTDPDCPFCNRLWWAMKASRAPDVQLRYLLVAVIDEDSRGKGAAILESENPAGALEGHERAFSSGGITPKATLQPATQETLGFDQDLMQVLHIPGTPGLIYQDEQGQVRVFAGMPNPAQLQVIMGARAGGPHHRHS